MNRAKARPRVRPPDNCLLLAQEGFSAGLRHHPADDVLQTGIVVAIAVDVKRKGDVGDFGIAAALGQRDHRLASLGLFRRLGARAGIEERELYHPLRRLAHDLERDVTAIDRPASANRGGAAARMRRAMAAMLSSRVWSATVTGPKRQSAGIWSP